MEIFTLRSRRRSIGLVTLLMCALFIFGSCMGRDAAPQASGGEQDGFQNTALNYDSDDYQDSAQDSELPTAASRYRIRTGSLDLVVSDTREAVQQISQLLAGAQGYVSDSYIFTSREGLHNASLTVRVPADRFDLIMGQLQDLGRVSNERTSDDDVTRSYLDLEARLKTLETQEERLRQLLGQAQTVDDILQVERELQRVRQEIEAHSAQFRHLRDQVQYSTINIGLKEERTTVATAPFAHFGTRIKMGLIKGTDLALGFLSGAIVLLIAVLPASIVIVPLALGLRWITMRLRKWRAARSDSNED